MTRNIRMFIKDILTVARCENKDGCALGKRD